MSCAACVARVEKAVSAVPGVMEVAVSLLTNSMGVSGEADPKDVIAAVEKAGYSARLKSGSSASDPKPQISEDLKDTETPKLVRRLALILLILMIISTQKDVLTMAVSPADGSRQPVLSAWYF